MTNDGILFALLDNSERIGHPAVAEKYRDLTLSWSRYDYHGPVVEGESMDGILAEASRSGARYCLVQAYGHVLRERWNPEHWQEPSFFAALRSWVAQRDFLVVGHVVETPGGGYGLSRSLLLVDLKTYREAGRPAFGEAGGVARQLPRCEVERSTDPPGRIRSLRTGAGSVEQVGELPAGWSLAAESLRRGLPVLGWPLEIEANTLDLEPESEARTLAFSRYLADGIDRYPEAETEGRLGKGQRALLDTLSRQSAGARRGVFLWNIEPYTDIETPAPTFEGPVSSLYSVAAGFKPNRLLQTHGFSPDTRVVFFDYSDRALEIRRHMVETWDGKDFPAFVQDLLVRFPPPQTFYQLWADLDPDQVELSEIELAWSRELERWGGEGPFRRHWQAYRKLRHEYLSCDLLSESEKLIEQMSPERGSVLWFSNAFFTMLSNWHYPLAKRRQSYESFVAGLAETAPHLLLYGSDYNNTNVNCIAAGEYWRRYRDMVVSELVPARLHRYEMRM